MKRTIIRLMALALLTSGCGGGNDSEEVQEAAAPAEIPSTGVGNEAQAPAGTESGNWVEYAVEGDFPGEGRDADVVICSQGGEGQMNIATRGVWFMDIELGGTAAGQQSGRFTVTPPDGLEGVPSDVFARRMKGDGSATIRDTGNDRFGLRGVEIEFAAPGLKNDGGQEIGVTGTISCSIL